MKKISFKKALAAVSALSLVVCTSAVTASASSSGATVEIDQRTLTVSEVQALDYKVPIFVKLTENAGLTAVEFGVEVSDDLDYTIVTDGDYSLETYYLDEDKASILGFTNFRDANISWQMTTADSTVENMSWAAWATSSVYTHSGVNILMVEVEIPTTVTGGEHYDITYRTQGVAVGNTSSHHLYYNDTVNYVALGTVDYSDGWIEIVS